MAQEAQPAADLPNETDTFEGYLIQPKEVYDIWSSEDPVELMSAKLKDYIQRDNEEAQENINYYNEFENRYEPEELALFADFNLHNLVFFKDDMGITDAVIIAELVNAFWQSVQYLDRESVASSCVEKEQILVYFLKTMFESKKINRQQVKDLLAYAKRYVFSHMHLYVQVFSNKQTQQIKPVTLYAHLPQIIGSLDEATEIIDPVAERTGEEEGNDEEKSNEEDEESDVDPDDPLYGIDERLANLEIDDEAKRLIKLKLQEANGRIKTQLEQRQLNLETKVGK